jgi:hypothetical protein
MSSKRSLEGYMLIDNSNSPGVPDCVVVPHGLPPGAGKIKFESATITCSHCECVVVLNPDRSRSRGYCKKCDHYICDACEAMRVAGKQCYPYKAMVLDQLELADKGVSQLLIDARHAQATSPDGCDLTVHSTVPDIIIGDT